MSMAAPRHQWGHVVPRADNPSHSMWPTTKWRSVMGLPQQRTQTPLRTPAQRTTPISIQLRRLHIILCGAHNMPPRSEAKAASTCRALNSGGSKEAPFRQFPGNFILSAIVPPGPPALQYPQYLCNRHARDDLGQARVLLTTTHPRGTCRGHRGCLRLRWVVR